MTEQTNQRAANTRVAPQSGPHASSPSVETTYEIEVMFPQSTRWTKTQTLQPFLTAQAAWDEWGKIASNDSLWSGAQARIVQNDRRVLPSVAEPVEGWVAYHHRIALLAEAEANAAEAPS